MVNHDDLAPTPGLEFAGTRNPSEGSSSRIEGELVRLDQLLARLGETSNHMRDELERIQGAIVIPADEPSKVSVATAPPAQPQSPVGALSRLSHILSRIETRARVISQLADTLRDI